MSAAKTPKYQHSEAGRALLKLYQEAWDKEYLSGGTGSDVAHLAALRAVYNAGRRTLKGDA